MCIIVAKKEGYSLPKKDILQNCYNYNDDGCGYMFAHNKQVFVKKGFTNFDKFYKAIKNDYKKYDLKNKNVVMHFRIGTSGGLDKSKTHPFAITDNEKILNALDYTCNIAVAHNGVLSNYCYNSKLSDTQNFIKDFLYYIYKSNKNFYNNDNLCKLIENQLRGSKLAIIDKNDTLKLYGDFVTDGKNDGVLYSNTSYKKIKYYNYNYWNDYNWDDYYDKKDNKNVYDIDCDNYYKYYYDYEDALYQQYCDGDITTQQFDDLLNDYDNFYQWLHDTKKDIDTTAEGGGAYSFTR